MISAGPSVARLAKFVNGSPFKPLDFARTGYPVIRIRQLLNEAAECDLAQPPANPVWLKDGDLVFSWSATLAVRRWNRGAALLNQHLYRVDTVREVDRRWFGYVLEVGVETLRPLMHGSAMTHITQDMLRSLTVQVPQMAEQRAIADYLDAETTRIDALIAKKQQLIHLLEERLTIQVETVVRGLGSKYGLAPLKHFAGPVTVGIVITPAKWYAEQGVPAVRGMNVSPGRIDMTQAVFLSDEGHRANTKSTLRAGDLVVVRTGQAGATAVVPADLDGVNCIDLLIVRATQGVRSRFLEHVLNSDWTIKHIGEHSVGSIQAHFNVAALREVPVPVPPIELQDQLVEDLDLIVERHRQTLDRLAEQIDLLAEHRQALITAAVTGEFAVPGAA